MEILGASSLKKIYKDDWLEVEAVNNINLSIEKNEFIGIMGPSGSGKTTLLNLLSGIDKPSFGEIKIDNKNIDNLNDDELAIYRRQKLGFVFQNFNLLDSLTVKENIILPSILEKKSPRDVENRLKELLKLFGIKELVEKYPFQTSGGQKQRVAMCRSLMNNPLILFADEPTGNLDSQSAKTIMKYLEKLNNEKEVTILMVTHDAFAASFCKKVIFLADGSIKNELLKKNNRNNFYNDILNYLTLIGGSEDDNI